MYLKKILSLITLVCLILVIAFAVNAFTKVNQQGNDKLLKEQKRIQNYGIIYEKIKNIKDYEQKYAGAYLDEESNLNINLVGEADSIKNILDLDGIKYHEVNYPLKHLEKIISTLTGKMTELNISEIDVDEQRNKVFIYMKDLDDPQIEKVRQIIMYP